jgi:hypothetical protein
MAGFQTQQNEIRTRFNTVWASRIPVEYPNVVFNLPAPPSPWCRLSIQSGDTARMTIGAGTNNYRTVGLIYVCIFVPDNSGDSVAFQRADEAAAIFRDWGGATVQCRTPRVKEIGSDGSGYYQVQMIVSFKRDELI